MTVKLGDKLWHKRHHDFEVFDRVTFEVVPRYKESHLSGNEWRQHVEAVFWFKGCEVMRKGCRDMQSAALMLGSWLIGETSPIPDLVLKLEDDLCDQPGCTEPPTHRYILKELFSDRGEKLDKKDSGHSRYYRKFCQKHGTRGDCGREDSDSNYIKEPI